MKPLIIFDLNGVLICKDEKSTSHRRIVKRPFFDSGMARMFQKFDVAVFTSCKEHNAMRIIRTIFTSNQISSLKFIWCRDRCKMDPDYRITPTIMAYDTIKMVDDVLSSPIINEHRRYNHTNVIMIDDSATKMRFNGEQSIVVDTFKDVKKRDRWMSYLPEYVERYIMYLEGKRLWGWPNKEMWEANQEVVALLNEMKIVDEQTPM